MSQNPNLIRWAFAGTGPHVWQRMAPAARVARGTVLAAICSRDHAEARRCAREFGFRSSPPNFEEMVSDPEIDVVYIATPNELHAPQAIQAIEAGKHVLVEKPLALNESDAQWVLDASRRAGVALGVGFQLRYHPAHLEAAETVRSGSLGQLLAADLAFTSEPPNPGRSPREAGRSDILMRRMVHLIDLALYLLEERPARLTAVTASRFGDGASDQAVSLLELGGGVLATLTASSCFSGTRDGATLYGTNGVLSIRGSYGPRGGISLTATTLAGMTSIDYPGADLFVTEIESFNTRLRNPTIDQAAVDALLGTRIVTAMQESARSRSWITLE